MSSSDAVIARILSSASDGLVAVLDEGALDGHSRATISGVNHHLLETAATLTAQVTEQEELDEGWRFHRSYWHHVGSHWAVAGALGWRVNNALCDARLPWLDELDAMSNAELARINEIGRVSIGRIRSVLETYYWRGDQSTSVGLWSAILRQLHGALEYQYIRENERVRVNHGIALAEQIIDEKGTPLAQPSTLRMIP